MINMELISIKEVQDAQKRRKRGRAQKERVTGREKELIIENTQKNFITGTWYRFKILCWVLSHNFAWVLWFMEEVLFLNRSWILIIKLNNLFMFVCKGRDTMNRSDVIRLPFQLTANCSSACSYTTHSATKYDIWPAFGVRQALWQQLAGFFGGYRV